MGDVGLSVAVWTIGPIWWLDLRRQIAMLALVTGLASPGLAGELRYVETSRPELINPVDASRSVVGMRLLELVYRGLVGQDEEGNWVPELAAALPKYDEADTTLTYQLKPGLRWPDGKPVVAADVLHSYMVYVDERSRYGMANLFEIIDTVEVVDELTVRFKLAQPDERAISRTGFFVMPSHLVGDDTVIKADSRINTKPQGGGPYVPTEIEDNRVGLDQNAYYFGLDPDPDKEQIDRVQLTVNPDDNVHLQLLMAGFVDLDPVVRPQDLPQLESSVDVEVVPYNSQSWYGFAYNCTSGALQLRNVRQAFSLAFNRRDALGANYGDRGSLVSGPFTNASFCYNPAVKPYPYNPAYCDTILNGLGILDADLDGWREFEGENIELEMVLSKAMSQANKNVCEDFARQLGAHQIKVNVNYQDERVWYERVFSDRDYDITFVSWKFDDASNIYPLFSETQRDPGLYNIVQFSHAEVQTYLERFRSTDDDSDRASAGRRLHELLHRESPYTFLWTLDHSSAYRSDTLKRIRIQPFYFFTFIGEWELED